MSSEHECTHCGEKKPLGGIFWVITNSLHLEDFSLLTLDSTAPPTSRKSDSHTHQTAWAMREVLFYYHPLYRTHLKRHEIDYYPRGRVELRERSGSIVATIWLNPDINQPSVTDAIQGAFYLSDCIIQVKEDRSRHYRHKLS